MFIPILLMIDSLFISLLLLSFNQTPMLFYDLEQMIKEGISIWFGTATFIYLILYWIIYDGLF